MLAGALGRSVQLVTTWERKSKPTAPPEGRLREIATIFCTTRSLSGSVLRLLDTDQLSGEELAVRDDLLAELIPLREAAVAPNHHDDSALDDSSQDDIDRGPWHFADGAPIIIVCAELPERLQLKVEAPAITDPDNSELARLTDLDALFDLYGHICRLNPKSEVDYRSANSLRRDGGSVHLVLLGGIDWNKVTQDTLRLTRVPIRQYSDDNDPNRGGFEVVGSDPPRSHTPSFDENGSRRRIVEDIGHFVRAPNPMNQNLTVTMCNAMYGVGVIGVVRTLTDKLTRDRNVRYLRTTFGDKSTYSILFRVPIINEYVSTPRWSDRGTVLHTWSEATT